jgi:sec-independent protein translocase protein TatC
VRAAAPAHRPISAATSEGDGVAITTPRRRPKNPEGRMPLREHLRELRSRFLKAGLAIALGAVAGWFLYDPVLKALMQPIQDMALRRGGDAKVVFPNVASPFNLKLKLSVYLGLVASSPVWLYQLWAFIVPGLTKKEKRYSLGFVGVAVPLFCAGIALAWKVLPNAINFFGEFTPTGAANYINADDYLTFVTQIFLAFGVAFVVPLLLVALNLVGVLSALAMAKGWRIAVFLTFLFAAVASPTPDAGSMMALAFPMVGLYLIAVGIAWLNDRRRRRRDLESGFAGLDDDEASTLDTTPAPVDDTGTLDQL